MVDNPRIESLRRRVEHDPASIAFAQLAEEYRRAGDLEQAAAVCRAGLGIHPAYVSARVTLGRTLIELGQLDEAESELQLVLASAPENLAARRGLAEIHQRRGSLAEALSHYETALGLAHNDPEIEQAVDDLRRRVAPAAPVSSVSHPPSPGVTPPPSRAENRHTEDRAAVPPPLPAEKAAPVRENAARTLAVLEEWLSAIHASRTQPSA
jgi:tetratricopeptide (TPR) repeat protein